MPTYASIGIAAPILLMLLRFMQGVAMGGQQGGVVLLAVEAAPRNRRGFFGSFSSLGSPGGVILANVAFLALTTTISKEALLSWGWRVPFLLSLVLVALALYIHFKLEDTPAFRRLQAGAPAPDADVPTKRKTSPVVAVFRTYPREIALTAGTYLGVGTAYYIFITFVVSYGTNPEYLGMPRTTVLAAVLVGSVGQIVFLPLAGALSDRIGRYRVLIFASGALAIFVFPFWMLVDTGSFWLITLGLFLGLGVLHSLLFGVQPAFFAERFSTDVRYSGDPLGIQIGSVLGGAFAPLIATALLVRFGSVSIAIYMSIAALITLFSVAMLWKIEHTTQRSNTGGNSGSRERRHPSMSTSQRTTKLQKLLTPRNVARSSTCQGRPRKPPSAPPHGLALPRRRRTRPALARWAAGAAGAAGAIVAELAGAGLLGLQLGEERGVGGEFVAGQAGVPLLAQLPWGQQAPSVGQDSVGALIQLQHVVDLARITGQLTRVGGDLAVAQKFPLVGRGEGFGVLHGHGRREWPDVALHDMQRHACIQQTGRLGYLYLIL